MLEGSGKFLMMAGVIMLALMTNQKGACMFRSPYTILAALGLLTLPLVTMAQPLPPRPLTALLIEVGGAGQPFPSIDKGGHVVFVPQTATARADILTEPGGSVEMTVIALDSETARVRARTALGQTLDLLVPHAELASLRIGDTYTLLARPQSSAR